jgi:hypothetical protein
MRRRVPIAVIFAMALTIAALLPIYVERTMTELMFADGSGGAIEWGWNAPGVLRGLSLHAARGTTGSLVGGGYCVGDRLRVSDYRSVSPRHANEILKPPQLPEPLQGAPDFGQFQLMAAAELFQSDALKTGPLE